MIYKVTAKRYGDSVEFAVEAIAPADAYQRAKEEANKIFSYKTGDTNAPTVSVKPVPEDKD